jgi:hypothetical protein
MPNWARSHSLTPVAFVSIWAGDTGGVTTHLVEAIDFVSITVKQVLALSSWDGIGSALVARWANSAFNRTLDRPRAVWASDTSCAVTR